MDRSSRQLTRITDLTTQLGLTSRSLRYYEQIGLIQSIRPTFEKYRFYTAENIERLKQIIVLRKMQIPVKDILRIYENESMSVVVETFVNRIHAIDDEIGALAELKRIVGEFLQTMLDNGVTKISALPLLYEEMDKQLDWIEERKSVTYEDLNAVSQRLSKPIEPVIFYHGEDTGYFAGGHLGQMGFGVNMGNHATTDAWTSAPAREEALSFRQPIFRDFFSFPGRGKIKASGYNHVTWIVGAKHLAAVINGEIRYCGIHFPYMALDLVREKARNIIIGSNGQGLKYFQSIRVSQLAYTPKPKFIKAALNLETKRSNNAIPNIHRLVTDEYGENYWFNGCAKYVMECLGEKDFDYPFFAGLTGDVFTQYYPYGDFRGSGVSSYIFSEDATMNLREGVTGSEINEGAGGFVEKIFEKCGYASSFVINKDLQKNARLYLQTLIATIDKGVPVIVWGHGGPPIGVFVGYEEYGKILLYITGNSNEPVHMSLEKALTPELSTGGWIFVGDKKEKRELAKIYREAICALPKLLTTKTNQYCFGAEAFRAWANDIESGQFDSVKPEDFDAWALYTAYVCGLATNGSCCHSFLQRARALNPDMGFLEDVSRLYQRSADMWNNDHGADLEALGGGFNVTLTVLQDKPRRGKIIAKIREFADLTDEIVRTLDKNLKEIK